MAATAKTFMSIAGNIFKASAPIGGVGTATLERKYRAFFGVTPYVTVLIWRRIVSSSPSGFQPRHLLWGLLFLKCYHTEHVNASLTSSDEKTFRKWSRAAVLMLANMKFIQWEERLRGRAVNRAYVSVDGTDFRILEPTPFSTNWCSFKFHGAGVRYEVGVAILSGNIVWLHGPFPCGAFNDLRIYTQRLKLELLPNECVVADRGYRDDTALTPYNEPLEYSRVNAIIRARHETVNRRFKQFNALGHLFRHDLSLHGTVMFAVANITHCMLCFSDPLFSING